MNKTTSATKTKQRRGFYEHWLKRPLDFVFSFLLLVLLSPLLLVLALLVRSKLGSPVIFRQARPGLNGKIFTLYKFRSMTIPEDPEDELFPDLDRMTKFGLFLRSSSLDELPEFLNILKGDMSIVGPRPLLVKYLPLYSDHQKRRHEVQPGLTGLAQVNGRNAISWQEKFDYDVSYVNNVSFCGDVKIVLRTIRQVIAREGINSPTAPTIEHFKGNDS